jgi:hypothetical protein
MKKAKIEISSANGYRNGINKSGVAAKACGGVSVMANKK